MNVHPRGTALGFDPVKEPARATDRSSWIGKQQRQFSWMVAAVFVLLLVPAAIGRLSGWSWRPWPPGREGYRSIVGEARGAAETYVSLAFLGW